MGCNDPKQGLFHPALGICYCFGCEAAIYKAKLTMNSYTFLKPLSLLKSVFLILRNFIFKKMNGGLRGKVIKLTIGKGG